MKKMKTLQGYIAYSCSAIETTLIGGIGVCDDCGRSSPVGYLVPVLNHYMCPDCFNGWIRRGSFYPEDLPFEARTAAYFESRIPVEGAMLS